jgi:hypothetical protein
MIVMMCQVPVSKDYLLYASKRRQAGLDCISDDKHKDDDTHSEEEVGDAEVSNSSGGKEEEEEEEEEEGSEKSEEEEQDEDEEQGDDLSDASEVASSRAPSKHLAMLVHNLQKEVEILKSTSQAQPVDELSSPNLHKRRRIPLPAVQDDEEASGHVDGFSSDYADYTDSAKVRTPRKRMQPRFRLIGSPYSD